jgi:bifunctional DNA-binding transcriptional regulator/antitoxin component of YhaV-PrlF toxin-antitoxin module
MLEMEPENWLGLSYHANQGSSKVAVVLTGALRRRLDIRAGDPLDVAIDDGKIVLTRRGKRPRPVKLVTDPVSGLPALSASAKAPTLASQEVDEILSNVP